MCIKSCGEDRGQTTKIINQDDDDDDDDDDE